jgi:hypothetical protein
MTVVGLYLFASVIAIVCAGLLLAANIIIQSWFFLTAVLLSSGVLGLSYWWLRRHGGQAIDRLLLAIATMLGFFGITLLIEYRPLRWFLVLLSLGVMFLLNLPEEYTLATLQRGKIFRRLWMMLWVFFFYAVATFFFGIANFFPSVAFWILNLTIGAAGGGAAYMIWRMYVHLTRPQALLVGALSALMVIELVWVIHVLPFGYLAAALIITWLWYLIQLLFRFHFGVQDIVWAKQWKFLLGNAILFALTLVYFIKWV